ncbi:MAG: nitroreductase family protein [Chloroflexi bacterium]|nr:nitroreductase family protein [Chloroflexota bacterium]
MDYDEFLGLLRYRRTIRRFKPDPIPDDYVTKILDAAHYAMSGGNSQPWEFMVVKDPEIKEKVFNAFIDDLNQMYYLELQRIPQYRHPAFNVSPEEKQKAMDMIGGWKDAPVYIIVLEDGRKMFGSVLAARSDSTGGSVNVFASSMGHLGMTLHLAAASLGLGSQRVDVGVQEPYRQVLKYPEPIRLNIIVPVGYPAYQAGPPRRLPLRGMVHSDQYDMSKYMRGEDFLGYLDKIRALGRPGYRAAIGEGKA